MPKLKSHSGAKKRFRLTARGKVAAMKTHQVHNLEHKSPGRRRRLRRGLILEGALAKKLRRVLPE